MSKAHVERAQAPYLRQWLKEHGQACAPVAAAIGLSLHQLYWRLWGRVPFTLTQARAIARYLRVDYAEVFPGDSGVDPRELIAQRVAEAGPERRLDPLGVRRSGAAAGVVATSRPEAERHTPHAARPARRHAS